MADEEESTRRPLRPTEGSAPDDEADQEPVSSLSEEEAEAEARRALEEIEEPEPQARAPPPPSEAGPGFLDRAWQRQHRIEAKFRRIGRGRYSRVLRMARKPEREEFVRASQITAIGIMVIGFLGFLILLFMGWLMGALGVK